MGFQFVWDVLALTIGRAALVATAAVGSLFIVAGIIHVALPKVSARIERWL